MARPKKFSPYKRYYSGMVATILTFIILFIVGAISVKNMQSDTPEAEPHPNPVMYDPIESFGIINVHKKWLLLEILR